MKVIKLIFELTPWNLYFAVLLLLSGIYMVLIAPLLFRFWIIPKIEKKYNAKLVFNNPIYITPFPSWGMPPFEIPGYIIGKLIGCERMCKSPYHALKKINYDIETATKSELIMSFVSLFAFVCSIISGVIVALTI